MKALELSIDFGRSVPLSFNLYNPASPCWNYLFLGGKRDQRNKLISSVFMGDQIKNNKKSIINLCSFGPKDAKLEQAVIFNGGSLFNLSTESFNVFNYDVKRSTFSEKHLFKIYDFISKNNLKYDPETIKEAQWILNYDPEEVFESFVKKNLPLIDVSLWERSYETTIPTEEFLVYLTYTLATPLLSEGRDSLFHEVRQSLVDFYTQNKEKPNMTLFLSFLKDKNYSLHKRFSENESLSFLFSDKDLVLNPKGNYFFIDNGDENKKLKSLWSCYMLANHIKDQVDVKRVLVIDNSASFFSESFYEIYLNILRTARKRGLSVIFSQQEHKGRTDSSNAFLSNIIGVLCLDLDKDAKSFLEDYQLDYISKTYGGINYLRFDLGVKEYCKTNLKYSSEILRDNLYSDSSFVKAELYRRQSEDNAVKKLTDKDSSRFIHWEVVSNKNKLSIGIWSVKSKELLANDLVFLDQELSRRKLKEGIVILDEEIDDDVLYQDYNFKKVRNKITFLTQYDMEKDVEELHLREKEIISHVKSPVSNAKVLFLDMCESGLLDLEF